MIRTLPAPGLSPARPLVVGPAVTRIVITRDVAKRRTSWRFVVHIDISSDSRTLLQSGTEPVSRLIGQRSGYGAVGHFRHELLIDHQGATPVPEHRLDERPDVLPRQSAVTHADARHGDAGDLLSVCLLPHRPQGCLNRLVTGPRPPVALLGAEVEDPGLIVSFPETAVPQVELPRFGLAPPAVFLVHLRVASLEGLGDPRPHRPLAVAAVGERLGFVGVVEQIPGDVLCRHESLSSRLPFDG